MRTRLKHRSFAVLTAAAVLLLAKTDGIDPEEACLTSSTCWLQYNFIYDDSYSACSGIRYVRKTGQTTGRYIGVILCSSTRYKLVMADNLTETFLNIGDGSGAGEDQCILIGGDEKSARVASDFWSSPATQGFHRSFATDSFKRGKIGYGPKDLSQWTGKYYPTWYECGVTVPGNASVITSTKPLLPAVTTTTSPRTPATWDDVTFGQAKFTVDRTFVVPPGVTKVDVICIGGGGGGRDGHASGMVTGDGGNSTFGGYLSAEGGKGASVDNSGGQGGYGTVANGGQGGAGGGCSAGAGAAGQTRGGGHGGKQPGSSTHPFCGAGGSSGGSPCGSDFGPGKSGPGGVDPKGRAGGFYGGGGGSRAGGRAGGGGGYSRAVIEVTPGERISLKVGKRGSPAYWAGQPASGVVVVAWGGPIDPTGSFVDYFSVSEPATPTTTAPPTTPITTLPRKACFRSYCSGGYRLRATCVNGFCECGAQGYNKYTCLPEVGSCRILANQDSALGVPSVSSGTSVHSCVGSSANSSHEVHVIGIYENTGSRSVVQSTSVNIVGSTRKPMVLVLSNYEPVRWIIQKGPSINIEKILLYSYYLDDSSVENSPVPVTKAGRDLALGDDSGGGNTAGLLTALRDTYGDVASFTGTYRTSSWTLRLPDFNTSVLTPSSTEHLPVTYNTSITTTTVSALPRKACLGSYCSGGYRMKATCVNGFCECGAEGYNKYTCLPEVGSCRILANQDSALGVPSVSSGTAVHSCVGSSANSSYEVHVIGIYENTGSRSVVQSTRVNIVGRTRKPMVLVLSSYEPVRWIIQKGPAINIAKVLLYSYHLDESSVEGSPVTVTKADRLYARGDDSGGGSTKELLSLLRDTYGNVASFTGTYRTSSWTLTLPDINTSATPDVPTTQLLSTAETATPTTTTATITTIDSVASCLSSSTCWLRYNFTYDDSYSACSGDRYVRKTGEITGRYIGVVLCSPTRYKLLMADNLEETFLNIGDGNGAGEDLCPLIGGNEKSAKIPSDFWTSPAVTGYYRYNSGEVFRKGPIGFGPADSSQWTGKYFPTWYECGVSVPGERTVVAFQQETTAASPTSTTETSVTPTPSVTWDAVTFGQIMYRDDDVFVVPDNVTKLDVICIGGGGGGRDNHVPFSRNAGYGGDGGSSRFGDLLSAEGGKGAKGDNTGGEGGRGVTANGGQGGIGGGCSAGAGAAGQTSGGGHGGLEAGSSTHPFCGAGGSSGGSTCGREFGNIAPGKSGPGGQDPVGRDGGLYGGGGGSRAGARAGGGGGYSRRVITVTPGQNITVAVGDIGTPYYTGGRPAPGVVVVSWGGPIDPNREFQKLPASV